MTLGRARLCTFADIDSSSLHSLLPGARKRHRGPRDGGVTKGPKKGATKKSTQRRELLFGGTTDDTNTKIRPCLPTERSKDTRTSAEKAELLAWVRPRPTFPPLLILTPPPPRQADRRAELNEIERQENKLARNKPASPVPMMVSQFLSRHAARC